MPSTEQKEKILIIEGDVAVGQQIAEALKSAGYAMSVAKNGLDGLKSIYDVLPHLVLLDVTLADADGYEVLEKKQAEPLLAKIPVFLISTQGVPINMRRIPEGSVTEFLMMIPVNTEEIVDKVNRHFGHEAVMQPSSTGVKKKLLWVEDDKLIGTILAKKLIASDFDLFHAKNGEEALMALRQTIPDVLVVDLLLPGVNGFEILQQVHDDERLRKIPTMVLSNLSKPSDIERAQILGAKKFMVKATASLDQIVAAIRELCK